MTTTDITATTNSTNSTNTTTSTAATTVKVYWRRLGEFPALKPRDIEVATESEMPTPPELGAADGDWNEMTVASEHPELDIDETLGLCGDMHDPVLIADAIIISAAIHRHLGLTPRPWDYDCLWRRCDFDSHREDDAECYFAAMRAAYGEEAEELARQRYHDEGDDDGDSDGSTNYKSAIERGLVVGDAVYANVEYHHAKTPYGGWKLVPMHSPEEETALTEIFEGSGPATAEVWLVRDPDGDFFMVREVGGEYQHIPVTDGLVLEFDADDEDWDGSENCYSAIIGRRSEDSQA